MADSQSVTRTAFMILAMLTQRSSPSSSLQVALIHPSLCGWQWKWAGGQLELPPTLSGKSISESFSIFCVTSCFWFQICKKTVETGGLVPFRINIYKLLSHSSKRCNHMYVHVVGITKFKTAISWQTNLRTLLSLFVCDSELYMNNGLNCFQFVLCAIAIFP